MRWSQLRSRVVVHPWWDGPFVSSTLASAIVRGIRAERARLQITQEQLAERLQWSRSQIYKLEAGARRPYFDEMPEICEALETTLPRLLIAAGVDDLRRLGM
jgi:transcriptional regulator with XRE-family HTH domain